MVLQRLVESIFRVLGFFHPQPSFSAFPSVSCSSYMIVDGAEADTTTAFILGS